MKRWIWLVLVGGCGSSSPANVAGDYSISGTYRANGCNVPGWTEGSTFTGVQVTLTQSGSKATATVMGAGGLGLDLLLGTHAFSGNVDGNSMQLQAFGTRSTTSANCTYTYNADIDATLSGDALQGMIVYTAATNGDPSCSTLMSCSSTQDFNGTRPPRS
jgi:hypothetical protein